MDKRGIDLLKYLMNQADWVTSLALADAFDVSVRTIRSYVNEINASYGKVILSGRRGYWADRQAAQDIILRLKAEETPQNIDERKNYIIRALLFDNRPVLMEKLANQLCISPYTLMNELSGIKKELKAYELAISINRDQIVLKGDSRNKRKFFISLVYNEHENKYIGLSTLQNLFKEFDVEKIERIIQHALQESQYYVDDYSLMNIILNILVTVRLHQNMQVAPYKTEKGSLDISFVTPHIRNIVGAIVDELIKLYPIQFSAEDIHDFWVLLATRLLAGDIEKYHLQRVSDIVGKECADLLMDITESVKRTYYLDLGHDEFMIRFAIHLRNLLIRLSNNIVLKNTQIQDIKYNYPFTYDISIFISNIIAERTSMTVSDDEIAYISLHVGCLIEKYKSQFNRIRCVILCPNYYSIGTDLLNKINTAFSYGLYVTNIITSQDDISQVMECDLLLSTVFCSDFTAARCLQISSFLSSKDIMNITQAIDQIKREKLRLKFKSNLKHLFRKDIFFLNEDIPNKMTAINMMCAALIDNNYTEKTYKEDILKRESISPSVYERVAIPHPIRMNSKVSAVAVAISRTPILWDTQKVNIVFMLAINEKDNDLFRDIFDFISDFLLDDTVYKKIVHVNSYDDFINLLISLS